MCYYIRTDHTKIPELNPNQILVISELSQILFSEQKKMQNPIELESNPIRYTKIHKYFVTRRLCSASQIWETNTSVQKIESHGGYPSRTPLDNFYTA